MIVQGIPKPVFHLAQVDPLMRGYYMDGDFQVWSVRGHKGTPTRLSGSITPSGRYYTLAGRTFKDTEIRRRAQAYPEFKKETQMAAPAPSRTAVPTVQTSATAAVAAKGYLLATLVKDRLVFGTTPAFHASIASAKTEAERIASASGAEIVVLQVIGKVKVQKAVWE